jgi:hypothetical protein
VQLIPDLVIWFIAGHVESESEHAVVATPSMVVYGKLSL